MKTKKAAVPLTFYEKRLLVLADYLDKLPRKRFFYGEWVDDSWEGKQDLSCGAPACGLGHAASMPKFRKLGLRLEQESGYATVVDTHTGATGESAAERIFGLSYGEASYLFIPDHDCVYGTSPGINASPKTVAKHIRRFVAKKSSY